jgi:hypothetical protein
MKQRTRVSIAAIATAAAIGGTGAILLPTVASAHAVTHTLTFTSVQQAQAQFSTAASGTEDKDVNKAGKVIGYDMLRFAVNPATGKVSAGVTVDMAGGFLYGTLQASSGSVIHGTVTGGTGTFAGATGTITATPNGDGTRTAVTITYQK